MHVQILATGSYVPERVVTNAEIDGWLGESTGDWLVQNVGIRERRWMAPEQTTSDLVVAAARRALERAGISGEALDLIVVSTDTPDQPSPPTAATVQDQLGATRAGSYDLNSACAGWVTALDQGARYLLTEPDANYVLVAGGYAMSRFLDRMDKKTVNLFADGAGAAILARGNQPGFLASRFLTIGAYQDALGIYGGGTRR
ncbi:MAG: ketoacyl-ACP synthase III, partial [Myxococcota bacterium]